MGGQRHGVGKGVGAGCGLRERPPQAKPEIYALAVHQFDMASEGAFSNYEKESCL